jgi:ribosomal-protein-alanine N-acetyltransferase
MSVALHQLSALQLREILEGGTPDLDCEVSPGALPPAFVLSRAAAKIAEGAPENWWSPFLILHQRVAVGGCAFKGPPVGGRVEVLYGISRQHRRQGFATAALKELARVAARGGAREVLAAIEPRNTGSIRTAEQCGFEAGGQYVAADGVAVVHYVLRCAD